MLHDMIPGLEDQLAKEMTVAYIGGNGTFSVAQSRALVAQLRRAEIYRDYAAAFRETTGLPIALRPVEGMDLPHHGDPREAPFCALLARSNHSCAACLQLQRRVEEEARLAPKTLRCFAGLCDSAVPVRVGENVVAFLQTGQVLPQAPPPSAPTAAAAARASASCLRSSCGSRCTTSSSAAASAVRC